MAVCGFLLLAVGLVFGQTLGHDFVYMTRYMSSENPQVSAWFDRQGNRLGLHRKSCRQLASR